MSPRHETIAIAGASLAGISAAQTLRDEGFDGRIVLIGDEPRPPYERPELSKSYLRGERTAEELSARPTGWFETNGVDLRTGVRVTVLDPVARRLELDDGGTVAFDRALVATGATDRRLEIPGSGFAGVLGLRTIDDADRIRAAAQAGGPAVVVGMGFIGAEVAASLRLLGLDVTVVEIFETALVSALGVDAGRAIERVHRERGVRMRFHETVEAFEGDGRVERVRTSTGEPIDCAFAVVGIGVIPATGCWPLGLAPDGGIPVGPTLETEVTGVFAAGDVASHDHPYLGPRHGSLRVEHYDNAIEMGTTAARNLLGAGEVYDDPHWFWSDQYDVSIQMVGRVPDGATTVVRGSYDEGRFCAFSLDRTGVLRAAIGIDRAQDVRRAAKLIRAQVQPDPEALVDPEVDLRSLV